MYGSHMKEKSGFKDVASTSVRADRCFVGSTGSAKTTIINLMARFYDIQGDIN